MSDCNELVLSEILVQKMIINLVFEVLECYLVVIQYKRAHNCKHQSMTTVLRSIHPLAVKKTTVVFRNVPGRSLIAP